jgi:hypothetical protein
LTRLSTINARRRAKRMKRSHRHLVVDAAMRPSVRRRPLDRVGS